MFALFANQYYYASGGWGDFRGTFASKDEAVQRGIGLLGSLLKVGTHYDDADPEDDITIEIQWWHVVDLDKEIIVAGSRHQAHQHPRNR